MIYKVLPDVKIAWRDVWIGAAVTALLFTIGKFLIGLYLGQAAASPPTYGAAGSLVVCCSGSTTRRRSSSWAPSSPRSTPRRYGSRIRPEQARGAGGGAERR